MIDPTKISKKFGIYMLICLLNGKVYIGKANNLWRRIPCHFRLNSITKKIAILL
jgi:predicted GIY-YIG superfamily endonuclease